MTVMNEEEKILKGEEAKSRYEQLKASGMILYECVVGSHSYGLNIETSDIDKKFIYIESLDNILTGKDSIQLSITKDYVGYEIGRYLDLLGKQNPNNMELLHTNEEFIEICHPLFKKLVLDQKNNFLSKKVAYSFGNYANTQINKAQGTNKKFMNPMDGPRKSLLEFAWVPYKQGSISLKEYIEMQCIPMEWIGLSSIDHMKYTFHLFVDPEYKRIKTQVKEDIKNNSSLLKRILRFADNSDLRTSGFTSQEKYDYLFKNRIYYKTSDLQNPPYGSIFNGPIDKDGVQPKMSSIPKDMESETVVHFNMDGFQKYCKDYKEYHEWLVKRNIQRFVENASNENNFDRKNMTHCHRLLDMCIEILSSKGVQVMRSNREELLAIRLGENTYQKLVDDANVKIEKIKELYKTCNLPEECDKDMINNTILNIRKEFYKV